MSKVLKVLATAPLLLLGVLATPAAADNHMTMSYRTTVPGDNPAAACRASQNVIVAVGTVGGREVFTMPLSGPGQMTTGGCVSTLTRQVLSGSAYVANCKVLEVGFAEENGGRAYPYAFYGNPNYLAENRADCVEFLRGFHTGTLQPGGGPG